MKRRPFPAVITFNDQFERADSAGLGIAPTGQTWEVTGAGYLGAQIKSGRFCGYMPPNSAGDVVYAGIVVTPAPQRIGGTFSFVAGPDAGGGHGVLALISSNDATITLAHMVHLILTPDDARLTWWEPNDIDNEMASGTSNLSFDEALAIDGTPYDVWMSIIGDHVHIEIANRYTMDADDPHVSAVAGSLGIWELTSGTGCKSVPRWDAAGSYQTT